MKISIIGSGNVATHLAKAITNSDLNLVDVYSKTYEHAQALAQTCNARAITELSDLNSEIDLLIVAINDDALPAMATQLKNLNIPVVHTSGSTSIEVFNSEAHAYGVLYPLQTFSKSKHIVIEEVPFFIEASNDALNQQLIALCNSLRVNFQTINSQQRMALHISAVFACNFSNYLYSIAEDLLKSNGLEFDLLKPLIAETAEKIKEISPRDAQTGPAKRNDQATIQKHIEALEVHTDWQMLYKALSEGIKKSRNS